MRIVLAGALCGLCCVLAPAIAVAQTAPAPPPSLQACTGTVESFEAAQIPEPIGALWLENVSCKSPTAKIAQMEFYLIEPGSGRVWQPGMVVAAAAYKRANVAERTVSVEFVPVAKGVPVVLRINAPCIADGNRCIGEGAAQN